jgi:hypothetical protein
VDQRIEFLEQLVRTERGPGQSGRQERLGEAKVAALSLPLTRVDPAPVVVTTPGRR